MESLIPRLSKKDITDIWVGQTLRLMLLKNTYTPNAAHQMVSDVTPAIYEITDSGGIYTAGGVLLTGQESVVDGDNYYLDATDQTIGPGATINYRYGVLYEHTGNQATSKIRAIIDFIKDQSVTNGTSIIRWNAKGIIYLT